MGVEIAVYRPATAEQPTIERLAVTNQASSVTTDARLYEGGNFTINIPSGARAAPKFSVGQFVRIGREFWGLIQDIQHTANAGGRTTAISGTQLKGITRNRITVPPNTSESALSGAQGYDVKKGATETIMKYFVANNMSSGKRAIYGLAIAADRGQGEIDDKYMTRHDNLSDVLKALGEAAGVGYDIVPSLTSSRLTFDIISGANRSGAQSLLPPVVFSVPRKTIESISYSYKTSNSKNVFYTTMSGAEYADEALTMMYCREDEKQTPNGLERVEMHMTVNADTPVDGGEYDELQRLALIQAEGYRPTESFTCDVSDSRHRFGEDYFLGDIVTVQDKEWGISTDAPVTAMVTNYTSSGIVRTATFGTTVLNVFGLLKRQIKQGG